MKSPAPSREQRKIGKAAGVRSAREFPWTPEEDALLGKFTDREVAERLNRMVNGVRDRRELLGKAAVNRAPQPLRREGEPREGGARLFATKSDRELRALLGWSYKRIRTRRRQLATGKVRKLQPEWTLEEDRLLGTKPDHVLARKFGRPVSAVRHRRWKKRIRVRKDWRAEDDKVLGMRTDREIALLLGRSLSNVAWRRRKLGIAAKGKPREWTPEEEGLVGSRPDEELARVFGRTVGAVEARRIELGRPKPDAVFKVIRVAEEGVSGGVSGSRPKAKPGAKYCTWSPEEDGLLGKVTDKEAARRLGYSIARVRRRRHLLGLACNNPERRHWTKEEIGLLGTRPDREVAGLVNRSVSNVRYKRLALGIPFRNPHYEIWKPEELALLGKLADEEVARRTGHSLRGVRWARRKRHIPSVRRAAPEWQREEEGLLGTAPDEEIAMRLKRTPGAVRSRRVGKGIPAWHGSCSA